MIKCKSALDGNFGDGSKKLEKTFGENWTPKWSRLFKRRISCLFVSSDIKTLRSWLKKKIRLTPRFSTNFSVFIYLLQPSLVQTLNSTFQRTNTHKIYYHTSDSLWKIWLVESVNSIHNSLWTWHDKCNIYCRYYIYYVKFVCLVTRPLGVFSSETKWLNASLFFLTMNYVKNV